MTSWINIGIGLCAISGLPALIRRTAFMTPLLIVAGAITGLAGCAIATNIDALSTFFAAPVFLLAGVGGVYAESYWPASSPRGGYVRIFFGLLTGALALVMTTTNTIFFVASWEIVAASSFFLIATNHEEKESRAAAWLYLATSHVATLAVFAVVALLHARTGTWAFTALLPGTDTRALFWLALIAFGIKAGVMPLHVWLPSAHAAAPAHVSAVMSGVAIKMGIYGLVRVLSLFHVVPRAFAVTLFIAGIVSSILGVAFALAQHDLKRLLAYHSIENIGIIILGLGIGLVGQSYGAPLIAFLGYAGALLHVWNHSLFKALLFFSAGNAIHAAHTREIDRMGGLSRRIPMTAGTFLIGAIAISGLPPLNGFVSEWLLYVAGFSGPSLLLLTVPALALTGALALACFVKAFGAVFLGAPRTHASVEGTDKSVHATLPLVIACAAIGLLPALFAPMLARVVRVALPAVDLTARPIRDLLAPLQTIALFVATIVGLAIIVVVLATRRTRKAVTWDCGYAAPTPRMQYTSSSFARGLVAFFAWAMPPVVHAPHGLSLFPSRAEFASHVPDTVLDRALLPSLRGAQWAIGFARYIQQGRVQLYLLYLVATLIALLTWSAR